MLQLERVEIEDSMTRRFEDLKDVGGRRGRAESAGAEGGRKGRGEGASVPGGRRRSSERSSDVGGEGLDEGGLEGGARFQDDVDDGFARRQFHARSALVVLDRIIDAQLSKEKTN